MNEDDPQPASDDNGLPSASHEEGNAPAAGFESRPLPDSLLVVRMQAASLWLAAATAVFGVVVLAGHLFDIDSLRNPIAWGVRLPRTPGSVSFSPDWQP